MAKNVKKSKAKPAASARSRNSAQSSRTAKGGTPRGSKSSPQRAPAPKRASTKRPKTGNGKSGKQNKAPGAKTSATKRRLGLRGAAPWATRHAAKHAAEAEARNAEPPRPGSARATLRAPAGAEQLKTRIARLHHAVGHIRSLRRNLASTFFEIGVELQQIRELRLHEAKGYSSFESFADRELDLGKSVALKLARVPDVFQEQAARRYGMDAVLAALGALDDAEGAGSRRGSSGRPAHPLKPPSGSR